MKHSSSLLWQSGRNRAVRVENRNQVRQAMQDLKAQLWIREEVDRGKRRVFKSK